MAGRSPARFLAPLALVGFAVALVVVVGSSTSGGEGGETLAPPENRTTTGAGEQRKSDRRREQRPEQSSETYTIQAGDTPSGIAEQHDISVERLLELNPDLDPQALTVGEKVRVE